MADQPYYSVFTKKGLELLTEAIRNGTKLGITHMAFGDGGGSLPVPNEGFTKLVNEVHRTQLNSLSPDPNNANWLRAEAIIASATGGFNIRELGLYAGDVLVAYSNYPATYKPNPSDGTARIMTFRMVLQIDNTASFELKIDADIVLATIASVNKSISLEQGGNIHDAIKYVTPQMFGAIANNIEDDTTAFKNAIQYCCQNNIKELRVPSGKYVVSDTLYLAETDENGSPIRSDFGVTVIGAGRYNTYISFKAKSPEHILFDTYGISAVDTNKSIRGMSVRPHYIDLTDDNSIVSSEYFHKGIAINVHETCGSMYTDLDIKFMYVGVQLTCGNGEPVSYTGNDANDGSRGWCEFNRFIYNNLWNNYIGIRFYGGGSYHGNNFETTKIQGLEAKHYQKLGYKSGVCYGIQAVGAINTNRKNDAYWDLVNIYNCYFDINFWGSDDDYKFVAIQVDNARTFCNTGGRITHEGNIYFEAKNNGWWTFNGEINGYNLKKLTAESINTEVPFGNFSFKNWSSNLISDMKSISNVVNESTQCSIFRLSEEPDNNFNNPFPHAANSGAYPEIFKVFGDNTESLAFSVYEFDEFNSFHFGTVELKGKPSSFKPRYSFNAFGTRHRVFSDSDTFQHLLFSQDGSLLKSGYKVTTSAFIPYKTNSLSLGSTQAIWKDCFLQNAVTVVSDERQKNDISELTQQELECAIACGKLYRRYKLNKATEEKGDQARFHIGVISQDIVKCFNDHGLDWKQYGVVTYEKWDAIQATENKAATYDEQGNQITPEIPAVEGRESGEIYMVRYEELNCFINAGLEYRLSQLEKKSNL